MKIATSNWRAKRCAVLVPGESPFGFVRASNEATENLTLREAIPDFRVRYDI